MRFPRHVAADVIGSENPRLSIIPGRPANVLHIVIVNKASHQQDSNYSEAHAIGVTILWPTPVHDNALFELSDKGMNAFRPLFSGKTSRILITGVRSLVNRF